MTKFKLMNKLSPYILLLALSIFAALPFFHSGFFIIHDNTQVQRTFEMARSLSDGMFPVRWVADLGYGYGYPIFNFYAPAFYYISGFLTALGLNALLSTKLTAIFAILLSTVSMYLLAKEFWGRWGGILSAVLYTYAPFHAVDIYVRGAFAESFAYGLLPLPFLGLYKIYKESSKKNIWFWTFFTALTFALLISSHNLSAFMTAPFLVILAVVFSSLYFKKNRKFPIHFFYSLVLGVILSAFYWIPALLELKFTDVYSALGGGSDFRHHFVCLTQFWYSPWGFAGSGPGCVDGVSFELGKLHILIVLIASSGLFFARKNILQFLGLSLSLSMSVFSIFLMTAYSRSIWEVVSPMEFFQFPWRFLLLTSFSMSFAGGFILWFLSKKVKNSVFMFVTSSIILAGLIFYYQKLFYPQNITSDPSENYTNERSLRWFTSKISDEYMPKDFPTPTNENEVAGGKIGIESDKGEVKYIVQKTGKLEAEVTLNESSQIFINIAKFPSWNFYLDGEKIDPREDRGRFIMILPEGKFRIVAVFEQTNIEKLSNFISFSGVLLLLAGIIFSRRKNYD